MARMGSLITGLLLLVVLLLPSTSPAQFVPEFEPQQIRLKDIAEIQTLRDAQLLGYGDQIVQRAQGGFVYEPGQLGSVRIRYELRIGYRVDCHCFSTDAGTEMKVV